MAKTLKKLFLVNKPKSTIQPCTKRLHQLKLHFPQLPTTELTSVAMTSGIDCLLTWDTTSLGTILLAPSCILFLGRKLELTIPRSDKTYSKSSVIYYSDIMEISRDTRGFLYRDNVILKMVDGNRISLSFTKRSLSIYDDLVKRCSLCLSPPTLTRYHTINPTRFRSPPHHRNSDITLFPLSPSSLSPSSSSTTDHQPPNDNNLNRTRSSPNPHRRLTNNFNLPSSRPHPNLPRPITIHTTTCPIVYTEHELPLLPSPPLETSPSPSLTDTLINPPNPLPLPLTATAFQPLPTTTSYSSSLPKSLLLSLPLPCSSLKSTTTSSTSPSSVPSTTPATTTTSNLPLLVTFLLTITLLLLTYYQSITLHQLTHQIPPSIPPSSSV